MDEVTRIPVGGDRPYDVLVGRDLLDPPHALLPGAERVAYLHAAPLKALTERLAERARADGVTPLLVEVPDAEAGKHVDVAAAAWDRLGAAGFTRTDAVVGVGGGAVTDLAGFVAATWLRGVRWVPVATSLLGMVDAAVGGKTGINTTAGKNLVGAFHPPAGVLCDLATLDGLPPAELAAGMAEVVKCGFIADPVILDLVERDPAAALDPTGPVVRELVERAVRVKADVVGGDLRESGVREVLNYGHTLAHAIEKVEGYRWRHGHAVAVGLVYAATLARLAGRLDADDARQHRRVLAALDLPTGYRADAWPELLAAMRVDKKARGSRLRFVVLDGLARPAMLEGPPDELLAEAYREISS
ncbi:3-dehydroquinate synthase [Micromonospora sp. WMMD1128]|uniref:3-dehydroquinate synthase n=1 Tax=Micromonospora sp. WMMD1128 TaxID=3015150 RepID=UPI00248C7089|nr:3-dehydroquinate synthase [Micromonospora sp. WMMD1128]WBB71565.1 3-dehydroquinate synthase [Micromonospora sp. WMMD1128]